MAMEYNTPRITNQNCTKLVEPLIAVINLVRQIYFIKC